MEMEIWKEIEGFEGLYEVSNYGRVRSLPQIESRGVNVVYRKKGKVKKLRFDSRGFYMIIDLNKNKKAHTKLVHRLVAKAFIHNPGNLPEVNHKNGIKHDNNVENLEWVTCSENLLHCFRVLKRKPSATGRFGALNPKSMPVLMVDPITGDVLREYESMNLASKDGFDCSQISKCCRGKSTKYKGYLWKLKNAA